ncbi:hypothetical protein QL285_055013 [Trifolium repens]|nr:hypothetical protein QL285_055013 [Trifolium repens]
MFTGIANIEKIDMLDKGLPPPEHLLRSLWTLMGKATNERTPTIATAAYLYCTSCHLCLGGSSSLLFQGCRVIIHIGIKFDNWGHVSSLIHLPVLSSIRSNRLSLGHDDNCLCISEKCFTLLQIVIVSKTLAFFIINLANIMRLSSVEDAKSRTVQVVRLDERRRGASS